MNGVNFGDLSQKEKDRISAEWENFYREKMQAYSRSKGLLADRILECAINTFELQRSSLFDISYYQREYDRFKRQTLNIENLNSMFLDGNVKWCRGHCNKKAYLEHLVFESDEIGCWEFVMVWEARNGCVRHFLRRQKIDKATREKTESENCRQKIMAVERDEAMLSLNKQKIIAYSVKYDVQLPQNELVFWAAVHKRILRIKAATSEQKARSEKWLIDHGFNVGENSSESK